MKVTAEVVAGFVGSVLSKRFDQATASPDFHWELWEAACSPNPLVAIAAPRGHAKSTAGTIGFGLAKLLFREAKHCLIVSDTEAQAVGFVGMMKSELQENTDLIELFKLKKDEKGEVRFIKDSETEIIVEFDDGHRFRVIAKGAEQKLRGLIWDGTRPDLVVVDDLENDELVMNKERRDKLRRWFRGALLPAMSKTGKLRMWGTILHLDSQLNRLMPLDNGRFTKHTDLKTFEEWPDKRVRGWLAIKYRAHNSNMTKFLWESRFPKDYWVAKREEYAKDAALDIYSQEYLNNPVDESVAYFKKSDLLPMTDEDKKKNLKYYAIADLAISEEARADWSVFTIGGVDEAKNIHILNVIRERMDGREIVDTILALQRNYDLEAFGIEEMQVSKAIGPFLREEMVKQNTFPNLVLLKHGGKDKIQRARSIQARMKIKTVKFDKAADWYPALEDELLTFPRAKHDDQVDTLAYLGMMLDKVVEAPTEKELEDDDYEYERRQFYGDDGRSGVTGY